jgi:hypothetical protein
MEPPTVPKTTSEVKLRQATVKMEKLIKERNRAVKLGRVLAKMALEVRARKKKEKKTKEEKDLLFGSSASSSRVVTKSGQTTLKILFTR